MEPLRIPYAFVCSMGLTIAACGPNRTTFDVATLADVMDARSDVVMDHSNEAAAADATDAARDAPTSDVFDAGPGDTAVTDVSPTDVIDVHDVTPGDTVVLTDVRDVSLTDVIDVPDVTPPADVPSIVDAADPCFGLDTRPDLNANSVPDCRENLVANGQFPGDFAPWRLNARATIAWSANDALALATSGSGLVTNIVASTTVNGGSVDSECVAVSPGTTYGMYTQYFMASGQPGGDASNATWITVQTYLDAGCTMPHSSISGGTLGTTKDAWATYVRHVTTTATDHGMRLSLGILKGATASPVSATFDNVLLVRE